MKAQTVKLNPMAGPKYRQIQGFIRSKILDGNISAGEKIPSESDLMEIFKVSRHTARQAIRSLEGEGLIHTEHGRGSFVPMLNTPKRSGRKNANRIIGILSHDIRASLVSRIMSSAEQICTKNRFAVAITTYEVFGKDEHRRITELLNLGVAGLIASPSYNSECGSYNLIEESGIPAVMVDNFVPGVKADFIATDNVMGAYEGTKALIKAGCSTIGFLSGYQSAWSSRERLIGYRQALREGGKTENQNLIWDGSFDAQFGYDATGRILQANPDLDGLLIANHPITEGVIKALWERDQKLIDRIRIATFDEIESPIRSIWPMVNITQKAAEIGEKAVLILLDRITRHQRNEPSPSLKHLLIPPTITIPEWKCLANIG